MFLGIGFDIPNPFHRLNRSTAILKQMCYDWHYGMFQVLLFLCVPAHSCKSSNGKVLNGYSAHLRVFSRGLAASEMTDLYSELALERESLPTFAGTGTRLLAVVLFGFAVVVTVFWRKSRNPKVH